MEMTAWLILAIFAVTILVVITGVIDSSVAAFVMSEVEALLIVDWNVMATLVSIWVIAGYFGKTSVPEWLAAFPSRSFRRRMTVAGIGTF